MPDGPQSDSSTDTGRLKAAGNPLESTAVITAILNRSLPPRSITRNPRWSVKL